MRIALIADSHFFEQSRFEECIRLHSWIAQDARARGCDRWLHAGDVYERKSTPRERQAVAAWVQEMAEGVGPGVIVRGNHDAVEDLPLLQRLDTKRRGVDVVEGARVVELEGVVVACLAWPQRGNLAAMLPDRSKEEVEQAAGAALRDVLRGLGEQLRPLEDRPRLFLGHVMVRGSMTSTGQPLVGCDFELGLEDLALVGADAYLLGHIHKGQDWSIAGAPVIYPGSPRRTAFGEIEPKGYVVLECDGHGVRWEFVEAPATQMVQVEDEWGFGKLHPEETEAMGWLVGDGDPETFRGAEVRFRYHVAADRRDEAARAADRWVEETIDRYGALSVKVEEVVIAETRSRTPEVAAAVTLAAKLEALWRVQQFEPGERREALLAKLSTVEEEARNAA